MILGLSWTAWLLMALATVPALVMVVAFYLAHRRDDDQHGNGPVDKAP